MSPKTIRVHIADDHKILIDGIIAVLKTEPSLKVVGYSLDGQEVINWFKKDTADVLVLDIGMPKVDGLEVLRYFNDQKSMPEVIVLTSYNDVKLIKEVLQMGARGFLTKESAGESIIEAIKAVQNGESYFSKDIRNKIINAFAGVEVTKTKKNKEGFKLLSKREFEILKFLTQEYSNKEIADELNISTATVETHKRNIMTKLGVKNTIGLAIYLVKNQMIDL